MFHPDYPVTPRSVNMNILNAVEERIDLMISCWSRILFVRFDVRFPQGSIPDDPAGTFRSFVDAFVDRLKGILTGKARKSLRPRTYGPLVQYVWAREQTLDTPSPHFHVIVLIPADRIRHPAKVFEAAEQIWANRIRGSAKGLIEQCRDRSGTAEVDNGVLLDRNDPNLPYLRDCCLRWGAYLAKTPGKEFTPWHNKSWSASQAGRWRDCSKVA